ncbi:MAG: hypothetical protein ACXV79_04910 [Methylobacter sp.]
MTQINVLVVDDSAVVRQVLTTILAKNSGSNVICVASQSIYCFAR